MKQLYWLIRRELWENKRFIVYMPLVLGGILAALQAAAILSGRSLIDPNVWGAPAPNSGASETYVLLAAMHFSTATLFVLWVAVLFQLIYCASTLHDERKDRSVLFWESVGTSNIQRILAKALAALVVIPFFAILTVELMALIVHAAVAMSPQARALGAVDQVHAEIIKVSLLVPGLYPAHLILSIPSAGWALLVSATVKDKPLLWTLGLPLGLTAIMDVGFSMLQIDAPTTLYYFLLILIFGGVPATTALLSPGENGIEEINLMDVYESLISEPLVFVLLIFGVAMIYGAARWRGIRPVRFTA